MQHLSLKLVKNKNLKKKKFLLQKKELQAGKLLRPNPSLELFLAASPRMRITAIVEGERAK